MSAVLPAATDWSDLIGQIDAVIDLEASARRCGALCRRRHIRHASDLVRMALAYGPGRLSLSATGALMQQHGSARLSDTAVMNRLRQASAWLGTLTGALLDHARSARPEPDAAALPGRRLRIIDGSSLSRPGSAGTDWRLHATYDPRAVAFTDLTLTDAHTPESVQHAHLELGDIALLDAYYAKPTQIAALQQRGADYVMQIGWHSLHLATSAGEPLDWAGVFDALSQPGTSAEHAVQVRGPERSPGGGPAWLAARLVVLRLSPKAAARRLEAFEARRRRKRPRGQVLALSRRASGYLLLLTSLAPQTASQAQVRSLYRLRWQIEVAFRRLKSGLGLDRLPGVSPDLAQTWLLAHLLAALLIDRATGEVLSLFSPERTGSTRALAGPPASLVA